MSANESLAGHRPGAAAGMLYLAINRIAELAPGLLCLPNCIDLNLRNNLPPTPAW